MCSGSECLGDGFGPDQCKNMLMTLFINVYIQILFDKIRSDQICQYKHAPLLHKTYNDSDQEKDWLALNFNQNFNARNPKFISADTSNYKIGRNITSN